MFWLILACTGADKAVCVGDCDSALDSSTRVVDTSPTIDTITTTPPEPKPLTSPMITLANSSQDAHNLATHPYTTAHVTARDGNEEVLSFRTGIALKKSISFRPRK